jgi:hypothetical protein
MNSMKATPTPQKRWAVQCFNAPTKEWVTKDEYADVVSAFRGLKAAARNRTAGARRVAVRIEEIQASALG